MSEDSPVLPYVYFGMFDGHAGTGAALAAANQLHHILHVCLIYQKITCMLFVRSETYLARLINNNTTSNAQRKNITSLNL